MSPAEILRAARKKIADADHWCTGDEALDSFGAPTGPADNDACQWCAIGALNAIDWSPDSDLTSPYDYLELASREMGFSGCGDLLPPAHLNDTTDHATVMALYDAAIALAEQEGR